MDTLGAASLVFFPRIQGQEISPLTCLWVTPEAQPPHFSMIQPMQGLGPPWQFLLLSPAEAPQLMSQQSVHNSCALCASAPRSVTLRRLPLSVWMAVVSKHFHFEISLLTYDHGIFHKLTLYQWHPITKFDFSELSVMIYSFTIFCKSRLNGEELKFIYNCHSGTENTWIQRLRGTLITLIIILNFDISKLDIKRLV